MLGFRNDASVKTQIIVFALSAVLCCSVLYKNSQQNVGIVNNILVQNSLTKHLFVLFVLNYLVIE